MLVAAGLEHKTPAEIADAYEAGFHADEALVNILPAHVFPRATEHIPEMLELAERLDRRGPRLRGARTATCTTRWAVPGLRRAVGQHARRRCAPAIGARSKPTSATPPTSRCGRRPAKAGCSSGRARGATATPAGTSSAPRWPCRYLGDRFDLHTRRHRQRVPAPRGRDRAVRADRRRRAGPPLGPRRVPPRAGQKMAKSAGNFERVTDARRRRHRPPRAALPGADRPLRPQAQLLRRARSPPPAAALGSLRGAAAGLGPPPADGPWAAPPPLRGRAPATGPRASRRASPGTAADAR